MTNVKFTFSQRREQILSRRSWSGVPTGTFLFILAWAWSRNCVFRRNDNTHKMAEIGKLYWLLQFCGLQKDVPLWCQQWPLEQHHDKSCYLCKSLVTLLQLRTWIGDRVSPHNGHAALSFFFHKWRFALWSSVSTEGKVHLLGWEGLDGVCPHLSSFVCLNWCCYLTLLLWALQPQHSVYHPSPESSTSHCRQHLPGSRWVLCHCVTDCDSWLEFLFC